MDLINKGLAWASNFCRTFESICMEVDDIMFRHVEQVNGSQVDMSPPTLDEFSWRRSFRKAGVTNGSEGDVLLAPTSDEVAGCKSFKKAGEANDSRGDVSPPTSDEVAGFKISEEAGGSSNFVNAATNPSGECLGVNLFHGHSPFHNALNNPAASGTVPATDRFQASTGIAVLKPSASTPEFGKSDDKKYAHVAEPSEAAVQAQASNRRALLVRDVVGHLKAESDGKKLQESQALETSLVMVGDKELQAGLHAGGPNQQKNDDIWESEWVIV